MSERTRTSDRDQTSFEDEESFVDDPVPVNDFSGLDQDDDVAPSDRRRDPLRSRL